MKTVGPSERLPSDPDFGTSPPPINPSKSFFGHIFSWIYDKASSIWAIVSHIFSKSQDNSDIIPDQTLPKKADNSESNLKGRVAPKPKKTEKISTLPPAEQLKPKIQKDEIPLFGNMFEEAEQPKAAPQKPAPMPPKPAVQKFPIKKQSLKPTKKQKEFDDAVAIPLFSDIFEEKTERKHNLPKYEPKPPRLIQREKVEAPKYQPKARNDLIENAVNKKTDNTYLYQGTDVNYIVKSPTISKEFENFHFIESLQLGHLANKIDEILDLINNSSKPVICVYNLDNIHWVTFCIMKQPDGKLITLYKDSFGGKNKAIMNLLKTKSSIFKHHSKSEQTDGSSCGIFAIENLRIIARKLNENPKAFIDQFEEQEFCSQNRARTLRGTDFPTFYQQGKQEDERQARLLIEKSQKLQDEHLLEVVEIVKQLQLGLKGITVQGNIADAKAKRTIVVQVGAVDSQFKDYFYRIQKTNDISTEELQKILMESSLKWKEGTDYTIVNNIIKVSTKISPN